MPKKQTARAQLEELLKLFDAALELCVCFATVRPWVYKKKTMKSGIHYHIRWSNASVDWKPFLTEGDATELAGKIKKPNESYIIVERDNACERCKEFELKASLPSIESILIAARARGRT